MILLTIKVRSHEVSHSEAFIGKFLHEALELIGTELRNEDPADKMHNNLKINTQKYKSLLGSTLFQGRHLL